MTDLQEDVRFVELSNPAGVHDEDAVRVHDGVEAVGNRQHRTVGELGPDRRLPKKNLFLFLVLLVFIFSSSVRWSICPSV